MLDYFNQMLASSAYVDLGRTSILEMSFRFRERCFTSTLISNAFEHVDCSFTRLMQWEFSFSPRKYVLAFCIDEVGDQMILDSNHLSGMVR